MLLVILLVIFVKSTTQLDQYFGGSRSPGTCRCVPSTMCADNAVIGQGPMDIRTPPDELCSNYFEICCENPIGDNGEIPFLEKFTFPGCGSQMIKGIGSRILSDSRAEFGEFPWLVAILMEDVDSSKGFMYTCGGSLIHPQVVLTAAHCVDGIEARYFTVRVGEWNMKTDHEPLPHQDQAVQEITEHPHYQGGTLKNDIALLFVANPFTLMENVGLICLPPPNFYPNRAMCVAAGWGKEAYALGRYASVLKKVTLPLVPRARCVAALRSTRLGVFFDLHRSFICAGGEPDRDTCKGDGGSPLVCRMSGGENRFFQVGMVSWGIGCGESETPGVYVNVPLYINWIDSQLLARDLDISLYKY